MAVSILLSILQGRKLIFASLRDNLLIPLITLSLLPACFASEKESAQPDSKLAEAIQRGVDFLLRNQNENGSWGTFESARPRGIYLAELSSHDAFKIATSALCTMALIEVVRGHEKTGLELPMEQVNDSLRRGILYLTSLKPVGRATGDVLYNVWAQAYTLQCLSRAAVLLRDHEIADSLDVNPEEIKSTANLWLRALVRLQAATGGWGYYDFGYGFRQPAGRLSTSFTTATALCALWDAEKAGINVDERVINAAINCLACMRTADKTYVYGVCDILAPENEYNRPKGTLGRTHGPNVALYRYSQSRKLKAGRTSLEVEKSRLPTHAPVEECEKKEKKNHEVMIENQVLPGNATRTNVSRSLPEEVTIEDLILGLDRMFQHHHFMEMARGRPYPHEGWYCTAGYYYLYGHFYAAEVISELPPEHALPYWRKLSEILIKAQQSDGSWWDFPLYGYHKYYGTSFALLTLLPSHRALSTTSLE